MAVIALYARATGRSYAASRALLFAVLLMLVWNPLYLVFDPGFGLSVVATAGIIWLCADHRSAHGSPAYFLEKHNRDDARGANLGVAALTL